MAISPGRPLRPPPPPRARPQAHLQAGRPRPNRRSLPRHEPESAIGSLAGYTGQEPLRVQVAAGWKAGAVPSAALWVEGELGGDAGSLADWTR